MDTQTQNQKPKVSKKALVIIVVLVLLLAALWLFRSLPGQQELNKNQESENPDTANEESLNGDSDDSADAINDDLEGIDVGDLEREFEDIDSELNNL